MLDAATVLEEYLADLTSLPSDLAYILDEIHAKEEKLREIQKKIAQRDAALQKFTKAHGALAENPKEAATTARIRSDFQECIALQNDKLTLAKTGLYIFARQVKKLRDQVAELESHGLLVPPSSSEDSPRPSPGPARGGQHSARHSELKRPPSSRDRTPSALSKPQKRQHVDGPLTPRRPTKNASTANDDAYCLCQQGSFGNMVACDNPNCKYEWFHWDCVGLTEEPSGKWYCPACRSD